ncbi:FERM and PDZ domain-containing protein 3 [Acipenser ruthenus]|uniref:FERM and PDZ domain-containing protein 3 n=1 Tax=Acipenser ruthenus TaxID=7906 RepID=A0A444UD21_ACIRT|nr:FERM and PDZ domain-containing protein 3 [Acipenser ruthenus]
MESGSLTPGTARQVKILRDPTQGFGFVAGSERPVIVRAISPGGPSEGKLLPGDQILAINEESVSNVSRERVIDLVRNCKESILLTVLQPHQSPKSAFISAAKKAKLRSNPPKVRFSEQVSVSDPDPTMLKEDALLLIPSVLKVFLENGQIKSFTFDSRTTVRDVMMSLQDRLSLRYIEHFSLVLESGGLNQSSRLHLLQDTQPLSHDVMMSLQDRLSLRYIEHFSLVLESGGLNQSSRLHLLQDTQPLSHVVQRTYFQAMKCLFRICFFPKDPADLLRRDPAAFEYLYIQSRNDVIKERFGSDWKTDVSLKLTALHIYITVSAARPNQKISLKNVEKEWGLDPFLPLSLLPTIKEKNVCKTLSQLLKTYQHSPPSGSKVPAIQAKLQYIRVLNELPPFGGLLFHTVGMAEKQSATTLLVGPRHGISHVIELKTNLTTVLSEFSRLSKIQLFRENQGVARVEVNILEAKPLVLLMEWPDATNFACLIAGYYKLFVNPKKVLFCRTFSQSHMIKADYRSIQPVQRPALSTHAGRREAAHRSSEQTDSDLSSFCYLHMREQQQQLLQQQERQMDINDNLIPLEESRPRTKSDPTYKSSDLEPVMDSPVQESLGIRARAYTLDPSQLTGHFYCDSCKAKLKAVATAANGGDSSDGLCSQILQRCTNSCGSREGTVDLISLPLPGSEKEEEEEAGAAQPPPPAIAAPPPGFRDHSSDEEDPKRRAVVATAGGVEPSEEVPVTLIDNVATRTVRDHAQELDDALVSTLQALEALAASEDYPHHHHHQPQQTAGLIVLAAITPESSLDSGHETNSSELTDVSEMVTAMKQHQNSAYLLSHHISKDRIFSRRDFPLAIPGCNTQALGGAAFSMGQLRASCPAKPLILSKGAQLRVSPNQETAAMREQGRTQASSQSLKELGKLVTLEPQPEQSRAASPGILKGSSASPQTALDPKCDSPGDKKQVNQEFKLPCYVDRRLSPNPSLEARGKVSGSLSPEDVNKALPKLLPVDSAVSAKSQETNSCQDQETTANKTPKPSKSKGNQQSAAMLCTSPMLGEGGPPSCLKDPQVQKVAVFHSSSHTDDERLSAKAKGFQLPLGKESTGRGVETGHKSSTGIQVLSKYPPLVSEQTERKERAEAKGEPSESKNASDTQKYPKNLAPRLESTQAAGSVEASVEDKKQSASKPKQQRNAPFLSFRNLLSATFPARMRRETDERQAQLQKVRQYELEFLKELHKPRGAQLDFLPQGPSPIPAGTPCSCQLRTSPLQKVPGISREQRRSCDCKRICRGIRLPDTPVGSALERRGRERTAYKHPPLPKQPQQQEGPQRPQTIEIKTSRIRSTSLESREPQEKPVSCLPACASRSECMGAPDYKKLMRRYSIGEADSSERAPLYSETKPTKGKSTEKEFERPIAPSGKTQGPKESSCAHLGDGKRRPVFSIQGEAGRELELLQKSKVGEDEMMGLSGEDEDGDKCCSFCFCYRKCNTEDESSEKDELSYSIPLKVLPGMQLDANTIPVVSKTLQVLDADGCSTEEEPQSQEIDLRTSATLEGSLSRVQALQGKAFLLPEGFLTAQLDANELLSILRQCAGSPQGDGDPRLQAPRLAEYKQELAMRFKEFRASCRRVAGVEKSPTRMLSAVTASFQVLCSLTETFIKLVCVVRLEAQRQELLRKVEEVALNYTFLLRAAEEFMGRTGSLPTQTSSSSSSAQAPPQPAHGANKAGSLTRAIKTLIPK